MDINGKKKKLAFEMLNEDELLFFMFDVSNAKTLSFGTPSANVLAKSTTSWAVQVLHRSNIILRS